jgi:type IV pilus assembly protein PilN
MIRVNLLGEAKAKRRRRVRAPLIAPGSGVMLGLLIGVMVVVLGVQYWRYGQLQAEGKNLDQQVAAKTREKADLGQVQAQYETFSKRKELLQGRINIIEQLKAQQSGPVILLSSIASAVSATDQLWLTGFEKKGAVVSVSGVALTMKAVADFMTRLKSTNAFKDVDLKETVQISNQDFASFTFTVQTEMAPPAPAPAQSGSV